jgi:hypothetical protein
LLLCGKGENYSGDMLFYMSFYINVWGKQTKKERTREAEKKSKRGRINIEQHHVV